MPRPSTALGYEIVGRADELRDAEDALLLEGGDSSRAGDPLYRAFEGLVELVREDHRRLALESLLGFGLGRVMKRKSGPARPLA